MIASMPSAPLFQIRLRAPHTASDAQWVETFRALSENRGACDEVWFSTGIAFPRMEWHREHAARLARYAADLRRAGIVPSLQLQATLGHGDSFACRPKEMAGRAWGGFTGPSGVECERCNCPRQPALIAYVREMARIYAEAFRPAWVWIDDDLRIYAHRPAVGEGDVGCWCDTWIPEIETWPRGFASRTARSILLDAQKPVSLRLRGVPDGASRAVWRAFGEAPATLPIRRDGKDARVVLPALSAWSAGWLGFDRS